MPSQAEEAAELAQLTSAQVQHILELYTLGAVVRPLFYLDSTEP